MGDLKPDRVENEGAAPAGTGGAEETTLRFVSRGPAVRRKEMGDIFFGGFFIDPSNPVVATALTAPLALVGLRKRSRLSNEARVYNAAEVRARTFRLFEERPNGKTTVWLEDADVERVRMADVYPNDRLGGRPVPVYEFQLKNGHKPLLRRDMARADQFEEILRQKGLKLTDETRR